MEETRRTIGNLLCALAAPIVVVVMVSLTVLARLAYYLTSLIHGFWLLFGDMPRWILNLKTKPLQKPHFLKASTPGRSVH